MSFSGSFLLYKSQRCKLEKQIDAKVFSTSVFLNDGGGCFCALFKNIRQNVMCSVA